MWREKANDLRAALDVLGAIHDQYGVDPHITRACNELAEAVRHAEKNARAGVPLGPEGALLCDSIYL